MTWSVMHLLPPSTSAGLSSSLVVVVVDDVVVKLELDLVVTMAVFIMASW